MAFINFQHADNTLLLGQCSVKQAIIIKWILCCFDVWSGLKINYHKNSLINLGKENLSMVLIRSFFKCREEQLLIRYMSIPLEAGKLKRRDWDSLFDQFKKKLEGWRESYFQLGVKKLYSTRYCRPYHCITCPSYYQNG